jgi:hypothetical membrane protein
MSVFYVMNLKVLRLAGFFGIVAPLFGLIIIGISVWLSPWFSWTGNALSDIGGAAGFESTLFNSGLAMTAALMMMFSTGLFEMTKGDRIGQVGSAIHLFSTGLLIGIGILNITIQPWHNYVSIGFFVTLPLSAIVIGYFCFKKKLRFYTLIGWGAAALAMGIWLLSWDAVAIPEMLSVSYIAIWQIFLAHWMYTREKDES